MARFMALESAWQTANGENGEHEERKNDEEPDVLGQVTKMMDRFMVRGSQSPMQWMLDRRAYTFKIQYTETAQGKADWVGDQIRYRELGFSMDQLRAMVHGLVEETREAMLGVLKIEGSATASALPPIPWSELRDDPTREELGHSFRKDERNPWPVNGQRWLGERLIRHGHLPDSRGGGTLGTIDVKRLNQWQESVVLFKGLILILVHMTGRQPARGPEILSIRHSSSGEGEGRNVFIEDSTVVTVTRYHKGYNVSGI